MDFRRRKHKLKPTDKIHTIAFECLIKVHGIKQFVDVYRENRLGWVLIRPPTFRGTQIVTAWVYLPIVSAMVLALNTCKTMFIWMFLRELSKQRTGENKNYFLAIY